MMVFLQILGSLGVFLYGMKVLSEAIQLIAGDRMRYAMATMTKNRVSGVFTGFLITCLLQSSSATTVIVVSFVNAGLLTLVESIGIIMGANLGTTLTAWIIALVGKFSVTKIALPMIGIGLPFFFIGKNRTKGLGETLIGFGLLFQGLAFLKDSVPDKDTVTGEWAGTLQNLIDTLGGHGYGSILIFLALGVLLTLIVQSSSAAMAITVTFALNGWIDFPSSCAIVLGENIGTTVTAWLASIGANANAKRSARAHFLFNVLGVLWMLVLFVPFTHGIEWLGSKLWGSFDIQAVGSHTAFKSEIGFNLALFHSSFNLLNILLLVGFVPLIGQIVSRWVKPGPTGARRMRLTYISQNMLNIGELNLPEAENATRELNSIIKDMFTGFQNVFDHPDKDLSKEVSQLKEMEDDTDVLTHDITEYLVRCSAADIGQQNATSMAAMLRIASELEEIGDSLYRLVILVQRKYEKKRAFSTEVTAEVGELVATVGKFIDFNSAKLFMDITEEDLREGQGLEDRIDALRKQTNKSAVKRMRVEGSDIKAELLLIDINNHFEKIGNHALNILQLSYYMHSPHEFPEKFGVEV